MLLIYIPQRWAPGYVGGPTEDFDLHEHLKAATAARRLLIQLVREDKALAYPHRASVMWRIGLALYAKAGGVPWKLAAPGADAALRLELGAARAATRTDGYNGTTWPYFTFQYWWQTRRLALDDCELVAPAPDRSRQGATCQVPSGVRTAMSRW